MCTTIESTKSCLQCTFSVVCRPMCLNEHTSVQQLKTWVENTKLCLQSIVSIVCRPMYTDNKQMCATFIIQTKISKPGFVDLVEVGCGRFFREGNTAICRASSPNWNSPLHIGVVSTEVSTRTRGPATLACKLQHSLLCSTARFGFTGCHCVLQLPERASE